MIHTYKENIMETLKLTNEKSTRINLEQLAKTTMSNSYEVPYSYEGINTIYNVAKQYTDAEVTDIWVKNTLNTGYTYNTSRYSGDPDKRSLLEHYIFKRLLAKIVLSDKVTGGNLTIAVKYDENKYTIALGANITVCSNFMIIGSDNVIKTGLRGKDKLSFDNAIDITAHWLEEKYKVQEKCNSFIEESNKRILDNINANTLIGYLARNSVVQDRNQILKNCQVTELCVNVNKIFEDKNEMSVWEFWNSGTNNLKPENTELATYIDNICNFTKFCDTFTVNPQMLITNEKH